MGIWDHSRDIWQVLSEGGSNVLLRVCAILAVAALGAAAPASAEPPLYLVDSTFNGQLTRIFRVDAANGDLHLVADLGDDYTPVFGLAAASGSVLYATGSDSRCGGDTACILLRIVVDPAGLDPAEVAEIGVIALEGETLGGISALSFDRDGWLSALSQTTEGYYRIDPESAQAWFVGPSGYDHHGGDLTSDPYGVYLTWSNIGSKSGLHTLDPATGLVSVFAPQPNVTVSGLAAVGHAGLLYGVDVDADVLREYDPLYGPTGSMAPLTWLGSSFDHKRGDLDSPWCEDDAACDDGDPCTVEACTPGGCARAYPAPCCGDDGDGDGIGDLCDGCPSQPDPSQSDRDGDGEGDVCDADDDDDGAPDAFDCAPIDPSASSVPEIVDGLSVEGTSSTVIAWNPEGVGFRYDLAGGTLSDLRLDSGLARLGCLANNLPSAEVSDGRPAPVAGDGYYYLVRPQNRCGPGTYGISSSGDGRPSADCP